MTDPTITDREQGDWERFIGHKTDPEGIPLNEAELYHAFVNGWQAGFDYCAARMGQTVRAAPLFAINMRGNESDEKT